MELRHLDLADLDSIRQFCRASVDFGHPLDVLICNAAVMACPERWQTKQVGPIQWLARRTADAYDHYYSSPACRALSSNLAPIT